MATKPTFFTVYMQQSLKLRSHVLSYHNYYPILSNTHVFKNAVEDTSCENLHLLTSSMTKLLQLVLLTIDIILYTLVAKSLFSKNSCFLFSGITLLFKTHSRDYSPFVPDVAYTCILCPVLKRNKPLLTTK